ncbi:unnamed protein product, partial [Effrenium voratum]
IICWSAVESFFHFAPFAPRAQARRCGWRSAAARQRRPAASSSWPHGCPAALRLWAWARLWTVHSCGSSCACLASQTRSRPWRRALRHLRRLWGHCWAASRRSSPRLDQQSPRWSRQRRPRTRLQRLSRRIERPRRRSHPPALASRHQTSSCWPWQREATKHWRELHALMRQPVLRKRPKRPKCRRETKGFGVALRVFRKSTFEALLLPG